MSEFSNSLYHHPVLKALADSIFVKKCAVKIRFIFAVAVLISSPCAVFAQATIKQQAVADVITQHALANRFPNMLTFVDTRGKQRQGLVEYTFDPEVHSSMAEVYLKYQPDYACFVAMDVETGAILNLTSFIKSDEEFENLVMRADYPAASVFKVITAAAGLDSGAVGPGTVIPYNGKSTSLYKKQVLNHKKNKWTRNPTFEESFAKSINAVFGRIGVYDLGAEKLSDYAERFGFNQAIKTDFSLPVSQINLDLNDQWARAEAASGYTKDVKLSPIHAAQIAATIANEGRLVTPYMVEAIRDAKGRAMYQHIEDPKPPQLISSKSADELKQLMRATTRIGSARKSFTNLSRYRVYRDMEIGGKTGSLTGYSPRGRHDWFVGYAQKDGRKVAYASLIINKEKWYVRSAYVARQFIYNYFTAIEETKKQQLESEQNEKDAVANNQANAN